MSLCDREVEVRLGQRLLPAVRVEPAHPVADF
jgi:hypothetical protein